MFYTRLLGLLLVFLTLPACTQTSGQPTTQEATSSGVESEENQHAQGDSATPDSTAAESDSKISAEQMKRDLDFLYENLQEAHFNLFIHTPKKRYDALYQQVRASLDRSFTPFEAAIELQRFMAAGRIGHARIEFPQATFAAYRSQGGKTAPFFFRVVDGRVYVTESYGPAGPEVGDEILAIETQPIATWLERFGAHISSESAYMAHSLLEFWFPRKLWLELGDVDKIRLDVRSIDDEDGDEIRRLEIPLMTQEEIRAASEKTPPRLELDWMARSAKRFENGVAYLRPGPFYEPESAGGYDPTAFRTFIDEAFGDFIQAGAQDLLIDIRDNPGGDNSFSDLMIAWFADRPFRFCSAFRIKVSEQTRASHRQRLEMNPNLEGDSNKFGELYEANANGQIVDFAMPFAQPREGRRFTGQVYLLINRHSFSNAVTVAALVQDYELGVVIGEKTSDLATSYGAMESFELPETRLTVGYPKAHLVRPNGDERLLGVTPDIAIETPLIQGPEDPVLQEALALIEALRSTR